MTYGQKIAQLRKNANMTQQDLGEKLNVSFQAVSKWEHDMAEPDLTTIKMISKIFNVSIDEFLDLDNNSVQEITTTQVANNVANIVSTKVQQDNNHNKPIGICCKCGTMVYKDNAVKTKTKLYCKKCYKKLVQKKKDIVNNNIAELKSKRTKGFILGGVIAAIFILLMVVGVLINKELDNTEKIIGTIIFLWLAYASFAFCSECFIDDGPVSGFILDCIMGPIRLPGLIVNFGFDGFILLILWHVIGGVIGFILGIISFAFGVIIGAIIAPFTWPFTIHKVNKEIKEVEASMPTGIIEKKPQDEDLVDVK